MKLNINLNSVFVSHSSYRKAFKLLRTDGDFSK